MLSRFPPCRVLRPLVKHTAFSYSPSGRLATRPLATKAVDPKEWDPENLSNFWATHNGGQFAEYATKFAKLDGSEMSALTEKQFIRLCSKMGAVMYNEWQKRAPSLPAPDFVPLLDAVKSARVQAYHMDKEGNIVKGGDKDKEGIIVKGGDTLKLFTTVTLPDGEQWPGLGSDTLFVRPHFPCLYEDVFKELRKEFGSQWLLTGSPGIAKSTFGLYCLWRVMTEGERPVAYQYDKHDEKFVVYPDGRHYAMAKKDFLKWGVHQEVLNDPDTVLISDSIEPACGYGVTLMVSYPERNMYKEFQKTPNTVTLTAPTWTLEELRACRATCFPEVRADVLERRYAVWGGNVGNVLGKDDAASLKHLKKALATVNSAADVIAARRGADTSANLFTERFFHRIPAGEVHGLSPSSVAYYRDPTVVPCSEAMRDMVLARVPRNDLCRP